MVKNHKLILANQVTFIKDPNIMKQQVAFGDLTLDDKGPSPVLLPGICLKTNGMRVDVVKQGRRQDDDAHLYQQFTDSRMLKALYPILLFMKFTGLFFTRRYKCESEQENGKGGVTPSQVFSTCLLVLHWGNLLRSLTAIDGNETFNQNTFFKFIFISVQLMVVTNATCMYVGCHNISMIPQLFVSWSSVKSVTQHNYVTDVRRKLLIFCIAFIISWMGVCSMFAWQLLTTSYFDIKFVPLKQGDRFFFLFKLFLMIFDFYTYSVWYFTLILFCIFCALLSNEFEGVNNELANVIDDTPLLEQRLGSIRQRHVKACDLVDKADSFLSPFVAVTFVASIANLCLVDYILLVGNYLDSPYVIICGIIWAVMSCMYLALPCIFAAYLNCKVRFFAFC